MGLTYFPNGVNIGPAAGGTAEFSLGGTAVTATADELNALGTGLSATELDYLDGATAGTVVASKAVVADASKTIDVLTVTLGTVTTLDTTTFKIATAAVTASAAELNYIDTSVPGTAIASKALVLGATRNVDYLDIAASGLKIAGTAVSSSAADLNQVDSIAGAALAYTSAGKILAAGTVIVTGSTAIVPSGIGAALFVVASPYGGAAGTAFANVSADLSGGGTVTIYAQDAYGTASTTAGTASYIVVGT